MSRRQFLSLLALLFTFFLLDLTSSQTLSSTDESGGGYTGYTLTVRDSTNATDDTVYETENTNTNTDPNPSTDASPPDVYLNASVSVGEIDITVRNLSAQINISARVLSLLNFNAGVDVQVDRVELLIQNVSAKVELEARLANLVVMINDTLSSIDLNPVLATLGADVGQLAGAITGGTDTDTGTDTTGSSSLSARSALLDQGILYSVNDYSGNAHTNRVLDQAGNIVDERLHNDGAVYSSQVVGSYWHDMTFTGRESSVVFDGVSAREVQYSYAPFAGLISTAAIFLDAQGNVLGTRVLSEIEGGGSSTIADD
ncbi:hypothetical protein PV04_04518 [Phialophora macrospora]|uniref:Uncharacterized protein n=1 Tax=Phialophora macrospora TaxID=1851006 RepID=A0A0D2FPT8_9EURO|nr:hypothetical protein PV04_04518 [Phialophora macrospora]